MFMEVYFPRVAIVILNWNGKHFLEQFLPSVCASEYPNREIYVADNASTDGSLKFLHETFPQVEVIENQENVGFAAGYNQALEQIDADYYILLNQDVAVEAGWIEPVIQLMESDKKIAACQPKIRSWKQKDHFEYAGASGGWIDHLGYTFCRGRIFDTIELDEGQYDTPQKVFWATGAALFIRANLYHEAGRLDPDFFAHMEEIDLCWRLQRMGYEIWCCPQSVVYHVGGGSLEQGSPRKIFLNFRNNLIMMYKNLNPEERFRILLIRLMLDGVAALKSISEGKFYEFNSILKSHWAYYQWRFKKKQRSKKIPYRSLKELAGVYKKSIVWRFFIRKKKTFSSLFEKD